MRHQGRLGGLCRRLPRAAFAVGLGAVGALACVAILGGALVGLGLIGLADWLTAGSDAR